MIFILFTKRFFFPIDMLESNLTKKFNDSKCGIGFYTFL